MRVGWQYHRCRDTIYIATIVLIVRRFAKTVFGREGYLTNTLPVSAHQLILSKLLVAFILDIISSLVILLSIGIIAAFCLDMKDILLATSYFGQILKEIGAFYLFIPSTILSMIAGILFYYLCISIGNLFNTNKVLMGFVAFFAIQAILFFIGFFFGVTKPKLRLIVKNKVNKSFKCKKIVFQKEHGFSLVQI